MHLSSLYVNISQEVNGINFDTRWSDGFIIGWWMEGFELFTWRMEPGYIRNYAPKLFIISINILNIFANRVLKNETILVIACICGFVCFAR